jgi:hypothetical protein
MVLVGFAVHSIMRVLFSVSNQSTMPETTGMASAGGCTLDNGCLGCWSEVRAARAASSKKEIGLSRRRACASLPDAQARPDTIYSFTAPVIADT